MLCQACGYETNGNEHTCPGCGTILSQPSRMRLGVSASTPPAGSSVQQEASLSRARELSRNDEVLGEESSEQTITNRPVEGNIAENANVIKAAEEVDRRRAEVKAAREAIEKAIKDAAVKDAAAKEALVKEKAAREEAVQALKEAAGKDAEARKAAEKEKAAAEDIQNAVDDFDRAMKEAAHRTASKGAYLERAEANKVIASANAAKEAADQLAAEAARKVAEAQKATEEINQKVAEEAAAKRAAEQAVAQLTAAEVAARKAAADEAAAAQRAAEEAAARKAAADRVAFQRAGEEAAKKQAAEAVERKNAAEAAARRAAAEEAVAKQQVQTAVAESTAEEIAAKHQTKEDAARHHGATENSPAPARPRFRYKINEGSFPSVSIMLDETQSIFTQSEVMVWMNGGMTRKTGQRNGDLPVTMFTSDNGWREICIASRFPGEIWCVDMAAGSVIVQKNAFLAAQSTVCLSEHVTMHMGGDQTKTSFVFQRLSGAGIALIAIGGSLIERVLRPDEVIKAHIANVAALEERVSFQTEIIPDMKKIMAGGEGRLLCTLTGPGRVWLQTLPTYASS